MHILPVHPPHQREKHSLPSPPLVSFVIYAFCFLNAVAAVASTVGQTANTVYELKYLDSMPRAANMCRNIILRETAARAKSLR